MARRKSNFSLFQLLWDAWCIFSIVGIWPRFIEPKLIRITRKEIFLKGLPKDLEGLKILQISDLHLTKTTSQHFLNRLIKNVKKLNPDLLFFTGDFINYSTVDCRDKLQAFLSELQATHGCYAILGNHDYDKYVSISDNGDYDFIDSPSNPFKKVLQRLFSPPRLTKKISERAKGISTNAKLTEVLAQSSFTLLHNEHILICIKNGYLNLVGLGEYMLGWNNPEKAFKNYDAKFPGIILSHNPDSIPTLAQYPGEIILCGHSHGEQVRIPWIRKCFTILENPTLTRGVKQIHQKWVYINRGLGSVIPFRWFSPPEILFITLKEKR